MTLIYVQYTDPIYSPDREAHCPICGSKDLFTAKDLMICKQCWHKDYPEKFYHRDPKPEDYDFLNKA